MKRFLVLLVAGLLMLAWAITTRGPDVQAQQPAGTYWTQYASKQNAAATNVLYVPGFRSTFCEMQALSTSTGSDIELTIYIPRTAGPATATDSIVMHWEAPTVAPMSVSTYFEFSDTMRCYQVSTVSYTNFCFFAR